MTIVRLDSTHPDFIELVNSLDAELAIIDGADHSFYTQFNKIKKIKHAVVLYENNKPLGCGAMKEFRHDTMEVKRMYTIPEVRKKGVATEIIVELEKWAKELLYKKFILETGIRQPDAIRLYKKLGYISIPNYGQYTGVDTSVCFEKTLI